MPDIISKTIQCAGGLPAFLATPAGGGAKIPAIVLMHERYGLVKHTIDLAERFTFLDCVQMIRRGGVGMIEGLSGGKAKKPDADEERILGMIDWRPALRNGNRW